MEHQTRSTFDEHLDHPLAPSRRDQHQHLHLTQIPSHHLHIPTNLISPRKFPVRTPRPPKKQLISPNNSTSRISISRKTTSSSSTSLFLFLILAITCISAVSASTIYIPEQMVETPPILESAGGRHKPVPEDPTSALQRLANSGPILIDLSPPPKPNAQDWMLASVNDLKKRQVGGEEEDSSTTSTKKATATPSETIEIITSTITRGGASSTGSAGTKTSSGDLEAETAAASSKPLPKAFDNGFNGNITESCQTFMDSMLSNSSFVNCLPFSLLLKNSNSFFQASKSITLITRVLEASCSANSTTCSSLLQSFALSLPSAKNCASDLSTENPLIQSALLGLQAYLPLYTASCLRSPSTSSFCFADAVTNKSSPTDPYIYYLPLNYTAPGGLQPTCNSCLKDTMAIFGSETSQRGDGAEGDQGTYASGNALLNTYIPAAEQVNVKCGPDFVNASLAVAVEGAAGSLTVPGIGMGGTGMFALGVVMLSWFF